MKKTILTVAAIIVFTQFISAQKQTEVLKHVVMFGWKEGTDSAGIKQLVNDIIQLPSKINLIKDFEYGINNSPENLNQGLTYCFQFSFSSEKDRNDYLVHPAHKAFIAANKNNIQNVTVFDYWAKK